MKKTLKIMFNVCLFVLCMVILVSCGEKLDKPTGFVLNEETLTISWNKVPGAKSYTISIPGEDRDKTTKANFISLEYLEAGSYNIKIRANGNGDEFRDSDWVTYKNFVRPEENGLRYTLINNDTEYMVTGSGNVEGVVTIPDMRRNKPVTAIGDKAFYNNSKITTVIIGNNVTSIGEKAFTKSSSLEEVIIPESVTEIGSYAFQSCKALRKIAIPDTVTTIAPFLFSRCDLLETVDFGESITTIGEYAFSSCLALSEIKLPNTVTFIDQYAFSDCSAANSLTLGTGIEEIGTYAFYNCAAVSSLNFGPNLKTIKSCAFGNCKTITSIAIPDSVNKIEYAAFSGCENVETITIGTGVTAIGSEAFMGTKPQIAAETVFCVDGWLLEVKDKTIEQIEIPTGIYGIADFAFQQCTALMNLDIKGVAYVGRASFYNCSKLWEVIFDDALLRIGENAFRDCKKLVDVTLGENLVTIDNYAFMNCSMLYDLDIPSTVTSIGSYAFHKTAKYDTTRSGSFYMDDWLVGTKAPGMQGYYDMINIEEGTRGIANYAFYGIPVAYTYMPDSVEIIGRGAFYENAFPFGFPITIRLSENLKYIGDYAFYGCSNWIFNEGDAMTELILPNGVEYIGRSAFYGCQYITTLEIPGTVKTIGKYAFYGCQNLGVSQLYLEESEEPIIGTVKLGDGIEYIGDQAFRNCIGITDITIPNSVTYLGSKAFFNCVKLADVDIGNGLSEIKDYTFYKCTSLNNVVIPDGVKSIGAFAFRGNSSLTELDLGSVEVIDHHAFLGCSALKSINIPDTVTDIKDYAFRGCSAATSVIIPASVINVSKHAFYALTSGTIYCEASEQPEEWNNRFNSMYRPIVWGAVLSEDASYVVSFTKNSETLFNSNELCNTTAPFRAGYTFGGWSDVAVNDSYADGEWQATPGSTVYSASELDKAPNGTTLYAIWIEEIPEE